MVPTEDRIAICQHPGGPGEYVPADHIKDGRCFMECDCTPRVYVAEDTIDSFEHAAFVALRKLSKAEDRIGELEAAVREAKGLIAPREVVAPSTIGAAYNILRDALTNKSKPLADETERGS